MSQDNQRLRFDLPLLKSDLPLLLSALSIARNTAMMMGTLKAQARLQELVNLLKDALPASVKHFGGYKMGEIAQALEEADTWEVSFQKDENSYDWSRRDYKGAVVITVGQESWRSDQWGVFESESGIEAIREFLADIAPLTCSPAADSGADAMKL